MATNPTPQQAWVMNIQRMSTEDGPGIRTTVFLKGCPLRCRWCHNPESLSRHPERVWNPHLCMGCGTCVQVCSAGALRQSPDGITRDLGRCLGCDACVDECPTEAMERIGESWPIDRLVDEALRDRAFFDSSGGGVTLSGGEPAMQPAAARAFLRGCRDQGAHAALDTSGLCAADILLDLGAQVDLIMFDLKAVDPDLHQRLTGQRSTRILRNLERLVQWIREDGGPRLWIRTPLIPGDTDTDSNISDVAAWLAREAADVLERWELCAFNHLCEDKYQRHGLTWPYVDQRPQSGDMLDHIETIARGSGLGDERVRATGAGRETP